MIQLPPRGVLISFGLILSIGVCAFIGVFSYEVFNQCRAMSFASTQGVVDSTNYGMTPYSHHGGGGYYINLSYHYNVADRQYKGSRVKFVEISSDTWTSDMARRFPKGSHPMVFYNPNDPAEAVLIRGIQGDDLFLALLLMPLTLIMLVIWFAIVVSFRKADGFVGLRILDEGTITRIRPSGWYAVGAAAVGLGLSALAAFFIFAVATGGHPTLAATEAAWGVVLTIGVVAGGAKFARIRSGAQDIVLNLPDKTLEAPKGVRILFKDIQNLLLLQNSSISASSELWIVSRQGTQPQRLKLQNSRDKDEACRLAEWIAQKVGASVKAEVCLPTPKPGRGWRFHNRDYRIVEKADQIRFILPRRPVPLLHMLGGYLFALAFLLSGGYMLAEIFRPYWIGDHHPKASGTSIDKVVVGTVVGAIPAFIGGFIVLSVTGMRFGRDEVRLSKAGLQGRKTLGPIRLGRSRNWKSLVRLAVDGPSVAPSAKANNVTPMKDPGEEPRTLTAYFSDENPLVLAYLFPRPMRVRLAKDLIRHAPRFGGGREVIFGFPPVRASTLHATSSQPVIKPLLVTSAPKRSRLVATEVSRGAVRIVMRRNPLVAMASAIVLALILVSFMTEGTGHADWLHSFFSLPANGGKFSDAAFALMSAPFAIFLIRALTLRIFEADSAALSRTIEWLYFRWSDRWARNEIADIFITTTTHSRGKGGSYTVHSLMLRRRPGRPVTLVSKLKRTELEWMRERFSAALDLP